MRLNYCLIAGLLTGCSTAADMATESSAGITSDSPGPGTSGTSSPASTGEPDPAGTTAEASASAATTAAETDPTGDPTSTGDDTNGAEPTEGCMLKLGIPGVYDKTVEVAGVERHYILVVPEGYGETAYPLVFAWHGRGGDSSGARLYFNVEESAANQAIFVYPDGLPLPDMDNQTGWDLTAEGEDVALFDAILAQVGSSLCVDASRVFSTGHSFGGFMSNALGCFRGGTVRAIAPVAGGGPFGVCTGQVAAWLAHGTLDEVVPYELGEGSRDHWTAANGCEPDFASTDPSPCVAYTGCDDGFPVHWCSHEIPDFLGHTWPAWAGKAIWSFFAQF